MILPRLVGQVLRGEPPGPSALTPPDPAVSTTTAVADVDAAAAGAAIDLLRDVEVFSKALPLHRFPSFAAAGSGCARSSG